MLQQQRQNYEHALKTVDTLSAKFEEAMSVRICVIFESYSQCICHRKANIEGLPENFSGYILDSNRPLSSLSCIISQTLIDRHLMRRSICHTIIGITVMCKELLYDMQKTCTA